ncbi:type IX secretion system protein PorQ [Flammeovirgaceae bacterium SG7u.111]|nr:type IX secretion system protein PorQ [Flammeovirgaceae bacterium SG7u.132]WPO35556.1 type IX secretion system protein PorQ [Flammeovirgaceae bacterium SG7u.111]
MQHIRAILDFSNKNRFLSFFLFSCFFSYSTFAQIGGVGSFQFVDLPINARQVGLGGVNITSSHQDPTMFTSNPALLSDSTDRFISFNHHSYHAGIQNNQLLFTADFNKIGTWGIAIQQLNYGEIDGYDENGEATGSFKSNDFMMILSHSQQLGIFKLGSNAKIIQSNIAGYQASGLLFDLGGVFSHPTKDLTIGLTFRNIGFAFQNYLPNQSFSMPFDALIGITFKPERMPFRLSFTARELHRFLQIAYDDPNDSDSDDGFGQPTTNDISFADKLSRHFVLGGEVVFSKNFNLRVGYNFLQRKELILEQRRGLAGFSFGAMLRVKKIEIAYSRSSQFVSEGTNSITITANTKSLIKKKKQIIN